ncbi:hypothetical protein AB0C69_33850, partial [Actinomadura sp. NPDC048032]
NATKAAVIHLSRQFAMELAPKVWVHDPGGEPWEVYTVKADADTLGKSAVSTGDGDAGCGTTACCTFLRRP